MSGVIIIRELRAGQKMEPTHRVRHNQASRANRAVFAHRKSDRFYWILHYIYLLFPAPHAMTRGRSRSAHCGPLVSQITRTMPPVLTMNFSLATAALVRVSRSSPSLPSGRDPAAPDRSASSVSGHCEPSVACVVR